MASFLEPTSSGSPEKLPLPSSTAEPPAALSQSSVLAALCNCPDFQRPSVWLIGDSYICRAAERAPNRPGGLNLGFSHADLSWKGLHNLKWLRVLPEVVSISRLTQAPTVLVIHAGGNDLCSVGMKQLLPLMCSDIERFATFFSDLVVVWSEVVPRVSWYGARNHAGIEKARRVLNSRLSRYVRSRGGVVIRHRQLEGDNRQLMMQDGIHLNDDGMDIFLLGLQDAIERALVFLLDKGRSSV